MTAVDYVVLDPTGNLTALVFSPVPEELKPVVTRTLLRESEQVAYLSPGEPPSLCLMGGEFCGNATMATAAWLLRDRLSVGEETTLRLRVSGAAEPVNCRVKRFEDDFRGTVWMPPVLRIREISFEGRPLTAVWMEGILHLIDPGAYLEKKTAEEFLLRFARDRSNDAEDAIGLLQWDRASGSLRPLVWVRGSDSLVWENGCGSGSAAVGVAEALSRGDGIRTVSVAQPGGVIDVTAEVLEGRVCSVSITGRVRLGPAQKKFFEI